VHCPPHFLCCFSIKKKERRKNSQASIVISDLATITTSNSSANKKDYPFKETVERQGIYRERNRMNSTIEIESLKL
jgi:hypothetical protein